MIIVKTPTRVSFCGGGSDLPAFYGKHGGAVLSAGLARYIYITIHPSFYSNKIVCKYSRSEAVERPSALEHPIFRVLLEKFALNGVELSTTADVPAGTGLGSSSAFTVGLLHALYAYTGARVSPAQLAQEACHTEITLLGEPIGKQDQYAAAFGGLNVYRFQKNGHVDIEPIILSEAARGRMERNLLLFYTGGLRSASRILAEQGANVAADAEKEQAQLRIAALTDELQRELSAENIDALGPLLHANWELKRHLASGITNPLIDAAYEKAMLAGASGGKLLGAGGGGFLLFYVPKPRHAAVKSALAHLRLMPFAFSLSGSEVVYGERGTLGALPPPPRQRAYRPSGLPIYGNT